MDLGSFEAALVAVFALLPGGIYTWVFEAQTSASKAGLADRLLRLICASAVFLVLALPGAYELYRRYVATGLLERGEPLPPWVWLLPLLLLAIPYAAGWFIGRSVHQRRPWTHAITGPAPANRAWDHLFSTPGLTGWIRLKLINGGWVWGVWGRDEHPNPRQPGESYASGYPEIQDLYVIDTAEVAPDGTMKINEAGKPILRGVGLLIRWDQVAYAEFIEG